MPTLLLSTNHVFVNMPLWSTAGISKTRLWRVYPQKSSLARRICNLCESVFAKTNQTILAALGRRSPKWFQRLSITPSNCIPCSLTHLRTGCSHRLLDFKIPCPVLVLFNLTLTDTNYSLIHHRQLNYNPLTSLPEDIFTDLPNLSTM